MPWSLICLRRQSVSVFFLANPPPRPLPCQHYQPVGVKQLHALSALTRQELWQGRSMQQVALRFGKLGVSPLTWTRLSHRTNFLEFLFSLSSKKKLQKNKRKLVWIHGFHLTLQSKLCPGRHKLNSRNFWWDGLNLPRENCFFHSLLKELSKKQSCPTGFAWQEMFSGTVIMQILREGFWPPHRRKTSILSSRPTFEIITVMQRWCLGADDLTLIACLSRVTPGEVVEGNLTAAWQKRN